MKTPSAQMQREAALLVSNCERERARLARLIHDDVAQKLTVANMELSLWRDELSHGAPLTMAAADRKISAVLELIGQVTAGVREISGALRPRMLDSFGLAAAVESLVKKRAAALGCQCEFRDQSDGRIEVPDVAVQFMRLAESLLNAVEQVRDSTLRAELKKTGAMTELRLNQTLKAMPEEAVARAAIFGGSIEQADGALIARLPLQCD
jgi:signal transduction histidine kinase